MGFDPEEGKVPGGPEDAEDEAGGEGAVMKLQVGGMAKPRQPTSSMEIMIVRSAKSESISDQRGGLRCVLRMSAAA